VKEQLRDMVQRLRRTPVSLLDLIPLLPEQPIASSSSNKAP
jgi:hypothetical protein